MVSEKEFIDAVPQDNHVWTPKWFPWTGNTMECIKCKMIAITGDEYGTKCDYVDEPIKHEDDGDDLCY